MIDELVGKAPIKKTHRVSNIRKQGVVSLWHFGKKIRQQNFREIDRMNKILTEWMFDVRPAIKRGDKTSIVIEFL